MRTTNVDKHKRRHPTKPYKEVGVREHQRRLGENHFPPTSPGERPRAKPPLRKVSDRELADLSDEWENPTVDTTKYYQSVMSAWETDKPTYEQHKREGGLCQVHDGRYYLA